jgi:hypothetical protein
VDAGAGEAILSQDMSWYLVSIDSAWRPVRLDGPHEVLRWALSRRVVNVGSHWETMAEAVVEARRLCQLGARTSAEIQTILHVDEERKAVRHLLVQSAGVLDRFLERRGHSEDAAVDLTLAAIQRLVRSNGHLQEGKELRRALFEQAVEVAGQKEVRSGAHEAAERPESFGREPWRDRVLDRLPADELETLALWADGYAEEKIAVALRRPPEEIWGHIERVAEYLKRPPEQLRGPNLAEACRRRLDPWSS